MEALTTSRLSLPLSAEDARDLEAMRRSPEFLREESLSENPSKAATAQAIFQQGMRVVKQREYAKLYAEMAAEETQLAESSANRQRLLRRGRDTVPD
ncbi:hypothetical protein [Arthrobacter sp. AQ5-05]|uniref:hypothetical protein n=1 Tax=Arthrobacter sp. AQ5-05 TaxID=2184581 RepID=UPI0011BD47D9|nr:hypothetical protein [Arthrobacter sp. AQ5-05]